MSRLPVPDRLLERVQDEYKDKGRDGVTGLPGALPIRLKGGAGFEGGVYPAGWKTLPMPGRPEWRDRWSARNESARPAWFPGAAKPLEGIEVWGSSRNNEDSRTIESFLGNGRADFTECAIDRRSNFLHTANGSESNQGNQQCVFD
jgi:hypothetical protein